MLYYNKKLKPLARQLGNNMTEAERMLWSRIRRKQISGLQFYRQRTVSNYIVDFYSPKAKLVIEIDGGQHYADHTKAIDKKRTEYLNRSGLEVIRFTNLEVLKNLQGVLKRIVMHLESP